MPELRDTGVRNVVCGKNVVIYQPANLYDCTLGDNVFVDRSLRSEYPHRRGE